MERLKLRGHHIGLFALNYWDAVEDAPRDTVTRFNEMQGVDTSLTNSTNRQLYGAEWICATDKTFTAIQENPDLEIEIVKGLDSICAGCPRLEPSCTKNSSPANEDSRTLEAYDLEVGKVYTTRDIIERVRDFTSKTGKRSPRDVIWFEAFADSCRRAADFWDIAYQEGLKREERLKQGFLGRLSNLILGE